MINNSLTLVGFAVSEYEIENEKNPYSPKRVRLEVEFFGMKLDDERVIEVSIPYIYLKRIDTDRSVLGKKLIVNGTIVPKIDSTGKIYYVPTAKDIYVIGDKENKKDLFEPEGEETDE